MTTNSYPTEVRQNESRLAFIITTINLLTLSLVLLLITSWGAYLLFVGVPDSTNLAMDELNQLAWLPYVTFGLSFVLLPIIVEYRRGFTLREMGLLPSEKWFYDLGWGFLAGFCWFLYIALLSGWEQLSTIHDGSVLGVGVLLGNYLAVAVGEEILFRAFLQRRLSQVLRPVWAIVGTGLVFGIILHLSNPLGANLLIRVPGGIMLGYLFYWRKNIWAPVAAHWLYNSIPTILEFFTT